MNQHEVTTGMIASATTCGIARNGVLAAMLLACGVDRSAPATASVTTPLSVSRIPTSLNSGLVENSVAVTSVSQPGVIFGLNDSGHRPELFAFDSAGRARGRWIIAGARNRDWEAASLGPCGPDTPNCLYIGDTGDNDARRSSVSVFRIPEPTAPAGNLLDTLAAERLEIRYPDHPHDTEAMYVGADGSIYLITKRRLLDAAHRPRPALVYRVPATTWAGQRAMATLVDSLPIYPGAAKGRQVTDAALSADGRLLAVRTYAEVYVFAVDSTTGRPVSGGTPTFCSIVGLRERQGEGIGWWWDGRRLLLTSEGARAPLHVIECPLPVRP